VASGYSVTISASDQTSSTIGRVNASLDAMSKRIRGAQRDVAASYAPAVRFGQAIKRFGETAGVNRMAGAVTNLGRTAATTAERFGRFAPALSVLTGTASAAGLAKMIADWTTFGATLGNQAARIGITSDKLQGLQGAARMAGVGAEALTGGLTSLQDNITNGIGGRAPEAVLMFRTLGISMRDAGGNARSAADVMPELANRIAAIQDPTLRARAATGLLGSSAEALIPLLLRGAEGYREYEAAARSYGVVNESGVAAARNMQAAQARLALSVEGLAYSVAERLAPVLIPLLDRLSGWIASHRNEVAGFVERMATAFTRWADSGGIDRMLDGLGRFGASVESLVNTVGGLKTAVEIFFGLWAAAKIAPALASMALLARGVGGIGTSLGVASLSGGGLLRTLGAINAALTLYEASKGPFDPKERAKEANQGPLGQAGKWMTDWLPEGLRSRVQQDPSAQASPFDRLGLPDAANDDAVQDRFAQKLAGYIAMATRTQAHYGIASPGETAGAGLVPRNPGASPPPLPSGEAGRRAQEAQSYFVKQGWTPQQAAGIVANLQKESGFRESAIGDSGQAFGIAQWHGDRQAEFQKQFGHPMTTSTYQEQLAFVQHELTQGKERQAGQALRRTTTAGEAGAAVSRFYERPVDQAGEMAARGSMAEHGLPAWRGAPPQPAPPVAAAPAAEPVPAAPFIVGSADQAQQGGTLTVDINHNNAPPGTRATARMDGSGARVGSLKVARAMPFGQDAYAA